MRSFTLLRVKLSGAPARGLFSILLAFAALAGCDTFEKPKYEVGDRQLLLIPFRDLSVTYGHGYGESIRGHKIIQELRNWVESNWFPNFCEGQEADRALRILREWTNPEITSKDWRRILGSIETDLALVGEIRQLSLRDPKFIGAQKGKIVGRYSLINARTGKTEYRSTEVEIEFPKPTTFEIPLTEFGTNPEYLEGKLLKELGIQIGKELYGYYSESR